MSLYVSPTAICNRVMCLEWLCLVLVKVGSAAVSDLGESRFTRFRVPTWPGRVIVSSATAEAQLADAVCVDFVGLFCLCV